MSSEVSGHLACRQYCQLVKTTRQQQTATTFLDGIRADCSMVGNNTQARK